MNFYGFNDVSSSGDGDRTANLNSDFLYSNHFPYTMFDTAISPPNGSHVPHSRSLSLGLQTNGENVTPTNRGEDGGSRSESDNADAVSGDDLETDSKRKRKRKRTHRHTPKQIQELEAAFKECDHPEEKDRVALSKRLNLNPSQVKFWFQNRRTQLKTQTERHENTLLRQQNDMLRAENMALRDQICSNSGEISIAEQQLRREIARLKEELNRVYSLTGKFHDRTGSHHIPDSELVLGVGVGSSGYNGGGFNLSSPRVDISCGTGSCLPTVNRQPPVNSDFDQRSRYLNLAHAAMDELVKKVQTQEPLWVRSSETGLEALNEEEYNTSFNRCVGPKQDGFVSEASKEVGSVIINSLALVETLMNSVSYLNTSKSKNSQN